MATSVRLLFPAALLLAGLALSGCVSESPSATVTATPPPPVTTTPSATPNASSTATPAPGALPLPTDCRAILTSSVLAQLEGVPLNDPGLGVETGVQPDSSLVCIWRDPRADTTSLMTTIGYADENTTIDMLNTLADDEGYTCYRPDDGVRCEKSWQNETYPVTDGRTLYYRSGVLIDTRYSNLAPTGYTAAIVASVFG